MNLSTKFVSRLKSQAVQENGIFFKCVHISATKNAYEFCFFNILNVFQCSKLEAFSLWHSKTDNVPFFIIE